MGSLLLIFLVVLFIAAIAPKPNTKIKPEDVGLAPERFCPPHKWKYEEVKSDEEGKIKTRIVCERCGPLKPLGVPERMDY